MSIFSSGHYYIWEQCFREILYPSWKHHVIISRQLIESFCMVFFAFGWAAILGRFFGHPLVRSDLSPRIHMAKDLSSHNGERCACQLVDVWDPGFR